MEDKVQKLKMHIHGDVKSYIFEFHHALTALKHGVKTHEVTYHANNHVEVIVEGERAALWKVVNSNRRGPAFCNVTELTVQFI